MAKKEEEKKEEVKEEKKEETPKEEPKKEEAPKEEKKEEAPKEEEKKEVPKKYKDLVEQIEKLSVLELSELVKILEDHFGVSAAAPVAAAPAAAATPGGEEKEEKSSYNIELQSVGEKKIDVIKVVRDITGKGLKEAKDLVDQAASAPQVIKEDSPKEEAEETKKKLEEAGAKVELK